MMELPLPYLKEIASQLIFISAFLGGFSAAVLGTLIISKSDKKTLKYLILGTALSSTAFIVSVMSLTKLVMIALPGYPFEVSSSDTLFPRLVGVFAFFIGIMASMFVISASGWMHSKRLGILTTIIGLIGTVFIFISM